MQHRKSVEGGPSDCLHVLFASFSLGQALSLGRDDKKKGGYGQQIFRILHKVLI
jgi:hypothetical protein